MRPTKLLFLTAVCFLFACKKDNTDEDISPVNFSGIWVGNWDSKTHNLSGTFVVNITQKENVLSGTISVPDIDMKDAILQGTVKGQKITFGDINSIITFSGDMVKDSTASGGYIYPSYKDDGTWEAVKPGINTSFLWPSDTIHTNLEVMGLKNVAFGGTHFFAIDYGKNMYKLDMNGQVLETMKSPVSYPSGLTYDGTNLLLADEAWGTGMVFRLDGFKNIAFKSPGKGNIRGLEFDSGYLWVLDDTNRKVYKQLLTNGSVVDSISLVTYNNYGLTSDGDNLWYGVSFSRKIMKIDLKLKTIKEFDYPGSNPHGLTYVHDYLWIADDIDKKIYKTDTTLNLIATIDSPTEYPAEITNDGSNLWVMESGFFGPTKVHKINISGNILNSIDLPSDNGNAGGLAFGDDNLWYGNPTQKLIFKIDTSGKSCFKLPASVSYLTWDGTNIWGYDPQEEKLFSFSVSGNLLKSIDLKIDSPTGMAWDGKNLWVLSEESIKNTLTLIKLDANANKIKTLDVYKPIVNDRHVIKSYGLVFANSAFWIFGQGPFETTMRIYKYNL